MDLWTYPAAQAATPGVVAYLAAEELQERHRDRKRHRGKQIPETETGVELAEQ